jgi:hypothetical protein
MRMLVRAIHGAWMGGIERRSRPAQPRWQPVQAAAGVDRPSARHRAGERHQRVREPKLAGRLGLGSRPDAALEQDLSLLALAARP